MPKIRWKLNGKLWILPLNPHSTYWFGKSSIDFRLICNHFDHERIFGFHPNFCHAAADLKMVLAPQILHFCSDRRINCICMQEVSWRYSNSHFKWFTTWVLQNSNIDLPIKCCSKKNCLLKEALLGNHTCPLPMIDFLKCFKNIYISSRYVCLWLGKYPYPQNT